MAHMLSEEELGTRIQKAVKAARNMEREVIVQVIQDFADSALGNGELGIADRLVQVIEHVRGSVAAAAQVETTVEIATEALVESELPPAREINDDVEMAHLIRHTKPTTHGVEALAGLPRD